MAVQMGIWSCQILYSSYSRLPNEKFLGLVYLLPCTDANNTPCTGTYVGETERTISSCFQEHTSTSTNTQGHYKSQSQSPLQKKGHHHSCQWTGVSQEGYKGSPLYSRSFTLNQYRPRLAHSLHTLWQHHPIYTWHSSFSPSHIFCGQEIHQHCTRRQGRPKNSPTITTTSSKPTQLELQQH